MSITTLAFQNDAQNQGANCYTSDELGGTLTRTFEGDRIIVTWVSSDGMDSYTLIRQNGVVYLNNEFFLTLYDEISPLTYEDTYILNRASGITWGTWHTFSDQVNTGGMPVALIAGVISAAAPWLGIRVIAAAIGGIAYEDRKVSNVNLTPK